MHTRKKFLSLAVLAVLLMPLLALAEYTGTPVPRIVSFASEGVVLRAYLYKPQGNGPFPALVWNAASSKKMFEPGDEAQFVALARLAMAHNFVLLIPDRHSNSQSRGMVKTGDLQEQLRAEDKDPNSINRRAVDFYESHNKDVLAAIDWLKAQAFVDEGKIVMAGHSAGAIQTLLTAEKDSVVRAFVAFSPGAGSWDDNPLLQAMLRRAVRNAKVPVLVIQAQNDFTLAPSELLGKELQNKGGLNQSKVYPPCGTTHAQGNAFALNATSVWAPDVFSFLTQAIN
jgi:dienelactone hydrolase